METPESNDPPPTTPLDYRRANAGAHESPRNPFASFGIGVGGAVAAWAVIIGCIYLVTMIISQLSVDVDAGLFILVIGLSVAAMTLFAVSLSLRRTRYFLPWRIGIVIGLALLIIGPFALCFGIARFG